MQSKLIVYLFEPPGNGFCDASWGAAVGKWRTRRRGSLSILKTQPVRHRLCRSCRIPVSLQRDFPGWTPNDRCPDCFPGRDWCSRPTARIWGIAFQCKHESSTRSCSVLRATPPPSTRIDGGAQRCAALPQSGLSARASKRPAVPRGSP